MPKVLNLRGLGGVVPEGAIYIGRTMPRYRLSKSKWPNPFKLRRRNAGPAEREEVTLKYERHLSTAGSSTRCMSCAAKTSHAGARRTRDRAR